jgi:hypothetical protein
MVAVALFWFWIFSGAPRRDNPDRLEDRAWVERAEDTCARTMAGVDERSETAGREDRVARADAIDASSADLRAMVGALRDPLPDGAGDREVVERWLADWEELIANRETYADAVRDDPGARLLLTEKFDDPIDRVIEVFADVNDMPACGPAGDVG